MPDNIRGLKVEISADATKFNKTMKDARTAAKAAQTDFTTLQKSLQLEFNEKKFEEAQRTAQKAIDKTAEMADKLRDRLQYLEQLGDVNTAEYQKLQNELHKAELKGQQLQKQLEQINQIKVNHLAKQFTDVGDKIQTAGKALAPFSALAAGAVTALGTMGVKAASTGAELDDLALRLGISAEKVQEYRYVTAQAGVEWGVFEKALIKARAAILDLSTGTVNAASQALQSLGLNIADFESKEAMFDGIIDALSNMQDKTLQAAYANEIFGDKVANQMLPYLNAGSDAINQFKGEFEQIGYLSNEQVAALATLDDTLFLLKEALKNVAIQIGASLAPLIKALADSIQNNLVPRLQRLAEWFNNLSLGQQEFALKALLVVAALAPLTMGIGKLVSTVGSIIKVLPQLGSALSALEAHPIIAIIGVIAIILMLLYTRCEAFREAINHLVDTLGQALMPAVDAVMQVLDLLMSILQPIIDLIGGVLAVAINVVSAALQPVVEIIQAIFDIITPLLDMLMVVVDMILTPIQIAIQALFGILQPLLQVALIPLKLVLTALKVPLQMLGTLLGWLSPLFQVFGNVVNKIFGGVVKVINFVLGFIEDAINFVIGIINGLIDGVNKALGWLGVHIDRIAEVKLRIDTSDIEDMDDVNAIIDSTPPETPTDSGDQTYDKIGAGGTTGDVYNNDYSTNNKTQNIQVTIQNYASEVDTDALVKEINIKLAEAM